MSVKNDFKRQFCLLCLFVQSLSKCFNVETLTDIEMCIGNTLNQKKTKPKVKQRVHPQIHHYCVILFIYVYMYIHTLVKVSAFFWQHQTFTSNSVFQCG